MSKFDNFYKNNQPYYKENFQDRENNINNILPKIITFSTTQFIQNWFNILKNNEPNEFVVIGVYDISKENEASQVLIYNSNNDAIKPVFYSFAYNFSAIDFYDRCKDLCRFIYHNKNKKFIVVSADGFYNAQSVARFISDFYLNDNERLEYIKSTIDISPDNFDLTFWLRRAYFNYNILEDELKVIFAMNKALINFKEPSMKNKN